MSNRGFDVFSLLPSLNLTLDERALRVPTEIQFKAIPVLMAGKSMVGVAETGSGKTLSYVLPILHSIKSLENAGDSVTQDATPRAVVIVPTRELGEQVSKVFKLFTHATRLRVRTVLGGTTMDVAKENLKGGFEVLVATPGRLVQMLIKKRVHLNDTRLLVFDEGDQMLDDGFLADASKIAAACPEDVQTALFSATVSPTVQQLMTQLFSKAQVLRTAGSNRAPATLKTLNKTVVNGKRLPLLEALLAEPSNGGTLIFTNTREQCDTLAAELLKKGIECAIYRGEMDKVERRSNLKAFREGKVKFLISTDLASRGLDVDHIERVINYHMPQHLENYIHRAGRTARAGRPGLVINFITERDQEILAKI